MMRRYVVVNIVNTMCVISMYGHLAFTAISANARMNMLTWLVMIILPLNAIVDPLMSAFVTSYIKAHLPCTLNHG